MLLGDAVETTTSSWVSIVTVGSQKRDEQSSSAQLPTAEVFPIGPPPNLKSHRTVSGQYDSTSLRIFSCYAANVVAFQLKAGRER